MTLGLKEQFDLERNKQHAYSSFVAAGKLNKSITREVLLGALTKLVAQRRLLRVNIFDDHMDEVKWNIADSLELMECNDTSEMFNHFHNQFFYTNVSRPLWKLTLLNSDWMVFSCDHTLFDGLTGCFMLEDLTRIINGIPLKEDMDLSKEYQKLCIPTPFYFLSTALSEIGTLLRSSKFFSFLSSPPTVCHDEALGVPSFSSNKRIIRFEKEDFTKLSSFAKKHGITFNGLWMYLSTLALSDATGKDRVTVSVPVNLRRFVGGGDVYGNLVSSITREISASAPWESCGESLCMTEDDVKTSSQLIGMLRYLDIPKFVTTEMTVGPRENFIEISNMGYRPPIEEGEYKLEEYFLSQPPDRMQHCFNNEIISSPTVTLIVVGGKFETKLFESYYSNLQCLVNIILAGSDGNSEECKGLKRKLEKFKNSQMKRSGRLFKL